MRIKSRFFKLVNAESYRFYAAKTSTAKIMYSGKVYEITYSEDVNFLEQHFDVVRECDRDGNDLNALAPGQIDMNKHLQYHL